MKYNKLLNIAILILLIMSIIFPIAIFAFGWFSDMNPRESFWALALLISFLILLMSIYVFSVIGIYALIKKRIWKGLIILILSISLLPICRFYGGIRRNATEKSRLKSLHLIGPDKLRNEAKILLSKYGKLEDGYSWFYVPVNDWPTYMKMFNPKVIAVSEDSVYIYYGKFINAGRGLCVFPPEINIEPKSYYRHPYTKLYDGVYYFMSGN